MDDCRLRKRPGTVFVLKCAAALAAATAVSLRLLDGIGAALWTTCFVVVLVAIGITTLRALPKSRPRWRELILDLVPVALFILIVLTKLPLVWAFQVWQADFESVAQEYPPGTPPPAPFSIGPFEIKNVKHNSKGTVFLVTRVDPAGSEGFVRHPEGKGFNLWSCRPRDSNWSFIAED